MKNKLYSYALALSLGFFSPLSYASDTNSERESKDKISSDIDGDGNEIDFNMMSPEEIFSKTKNDNKIYSDDKDKYETSIKLDTNNECNDLNYQNFSTKAIYGEYEDTGINSDINNGIRFLDSLNESKKECDKNNNNKNIINVQNQFDSNSKILNANDYKVPSNSLNSNLNTINLEDGNIKNGNISVLGKDVLAILKQAANEQESKQNNQNKINFFNSNNQISHDKSENNLYNHNEFSNIKFLPLSTVHDYFDSKRSPYSKIPDGFSPMQRLRAIEDVLKEPKRWKNCKAMKDDEKNKNIVGEFIDVFGKTYYHVPLSTILSRCETDFAEGIKDQESLDMLKTFRNIYLCNKCDRLKCFHELTMKNLLIHFIEEMIILPIKFTGNNKVYSYEELIKILTYVYYEDLDENKKKYELAWFGYTNCDKIKDISEKLNKLKIKKHCFTNKKLIEEKLEEIEELKLERNSLKVEWDKAGELKLNLSDKTLEKICCLLCNCSNHGNF